MFGLCEDKVQVIRPHYNCTSFLLTFQYILKTF